MKNMTKLESQKSNEPTAYTVTVNTPFKKLGLLFEDEQLVKVDFLDAETDAVNSLEIAPLQAVAQLKQYCTDASFVFDVPLLLRGTDFQKRVWQAIQAIPVGQVRSYGELAEQLGTSARAVGNACAKNPVPVIIPCHRVVASNHFGGYAGETLKKSPQGLIRIKAWLLLHEGVLQAQMDSEQLH